MGWSFPWASSYASDYNFDVEISRAEEVTRGWPAGGVPPVAAQFAYDCGTEPAAYLSESPVMNTYALDDGTVYLDLLHHRPRPGVHDGLLRLPRPRPARPQRRRLAPDVAAPPRRIRQPVTPAETGATGRSPR